MCIQCVRTTGWSCHASFFFLCFLFSFKHFKVSKSIAIGTLSSLQKETPCACSRLLHSPLCTQTSLLLRRKHNQHRNREAPGSPLYSKPMYPSWHSFLLQFISELVSKRNRCFMAIILLLRSTNQCQCQLSVLICPGPSLSPQNLRKLIPGRWELVSLQPFSILGISKNSSTLMHISG